MLVWPSRAEVAATLPGWASKAAVRHPTLLRLGCFGSFSRGNWGVGSDLDLVAVVESSENPFERRSTDWDLNELPVPADLLVYTQDEWERLVRQGGRFAATLASEVNWLFVAAP